MDNPLQVPDTGANRFRSGAKLHTDEPQRGAFRGRSLSWLPGQCGNSISRDGNGVVVSAASGQAIPSVAVARPSSLGGPLTAAAAPLPGTLPEQLKWATSYYWLHEQSKELAVVSSRGGRPEFERIRLRFHDLVMSAYRKYGGKEEGLGLIPPDAFKAEVAYSLLERMAREADRAGSAERAGKIRADLESIAVETRREAVRLAMKYGISGPSPVSSNPADWFDGYRWLVHHEGSAQVRVRYDCAEEFSKAISRAYDRVRRGFQKYDGDEAGLPEPELFTQKAEQYYRGFRELAHRAEQAGEEVWAVSMRRRLCAINNAIRSEVAELAGKYGIPDAPAPRPPAAPQPPALLTVEPPASPDLSQSIVRQVNPMIPTPAAVPPVGIPDWVEDDFEVEQALIDGMLPPRFDASPLIREARTFEHLGLADELLMGKLPFGSIDGWLAQCTADNEEGRNALNIECLETFRRTVERALRETYPGRTDEPWLEKVRLFLCRRAELQAGQADSA